MTLRFVLAALTVIGGILSVAAGCLVAAYGVRSRRQTEAERQVELWFGLASDEHDREYGAYHDALDQRNYEAMIENSSGSETTAYELPPPPPGPFDGQSMSEHANLIQTTYRRRYRRVFGREPGEEPPAMSARDEVLAELRGPAIIAIVGSVISTVAGTWSLYLNP